MVSYTENHAQLRWGGTAWDGIEQWSVGLRLRHLGGDAIGPMQEECLATIDEVVDLVKALYTTGGFHPVNNQFDWLRLNVIKAEDGKYAYPNAPVIREGITFTESGEQAQAPQVALCVTTRGLFKRGPAARGRMFFPIKRTVLDPDGQVTAGFAGAVADYVGTFFNGLANIDSGLGPNAWNPFLFGYGQDGPQQSPIDRIEVGRVLDTQRRRRSDLHEDYVVSTTWAG